MLSDCRTKAGEVRLLISRIPGCKDKINNESLAGCRNLEIILLTGCRNSLADCRQPPSARTAARAERNGEGQSATLRAASITRIITARAARMTRMITAGT